MALDSFRYTLYYRNARRAAAASTTKAATRKTMFGSGSGISGIGR
jgi:hypothetical protein